jgi:hypothetical protein
MKEYSNSDAIKLSLTHRQTSKHKKNAYI